MVPPNRGVKPPGIVSWKEKQFGSAATIAIATGSGVFPSRVTTGQSVPTPIPSISPIRSVDPLPYTPPRFVGLRK